MARLVRQYLGRAAQQGPADRLGRKIAVPREFPGGCRRILARASTRLGQFRQLDRTRRRWPRNSARSYRPLARWKTNSAAAEPFGNFCPTAAVVSDRAEFPARTRKASQGSSEERDSAALHRARPDPTAQRHERSLQSPEPRGPPDGAAQICEGWRARIAAPGDDDSRD